MKYNKLIQNALMNTIINYKLKTTYHIDLNYTK